MKESLTSREISDQGQALVRERLTKLRYSVLAAGRPSVGHFLVSGEDGDRTRSVWVSANLKPKPAGGGGPPGLNWHLWRNVKADVIALVDLSTKRVWLLERREVERTTQQHNPTYHHMIMVTQRGWTSAPHPRIRDDQFEHLLFERRAESLFGKGTPRLRAPMEPNPRMQPPKAASGTPEHTRLPELVEAIRLLSSLKLIACR